MKELRKTPKVRLALTWTIIGACFLLLAQAEPNTGASGNAQSERRTGSRPNILLCIADDMSWEHTGIEGCVAVKTPNFDRTARAGVRFKQAYCSSPSCTPSRGALLSGQAFSRLEQGASLLSTLPAKFKLYPDLLEQAGYQVGCTGKGWSPGDWRPGGRTRNPAGPAYPSFAAFLEKVSKDKPFCFWFGSTDPHRPYVPGAGTNSGINLNQIQIPPVVPDTPEIRADLADYLFEVQRFDADVGTMISQLEERGLLTNTIIVVTSDNGMPFPRAKCNLYDWGTHMPLAVAWPGRIPANRTISDFVSLTDLAPTFLEAAGVPVPAEMTGHSLLPMLFSHKEGRIERGRDRVFFGRERHDRFRLENETPVGYPARAIRTEQLLFIRNFKPERIPSGDSTTVNQDNDCGPAKTYVVTHKDDSLVEPYYLRAYGKRPAEELYDLAKDPGQTNNVASNPEYADALKRLRSELDDYLKRINDPRRPGGLNPDIFDSYPVYGNPRKK